MPTNNVKYLFHAIGHFPANETINPVDATISHASYSDLRTQLRRDGKAVLLCVYQGGGLLSVIRDKTYSQLDESRTIIIIIALYRDTMVFRDKALLGIGYPRYTTTNSSISSSEWHTQQ